MREGKLVKHRLLAENDWMFWEGETSYRLAQRWDIGPGVTGIWVLLTLIVSLWSFFSFLRVIIVSLVVSDLILTVCGVFTAHLLSLVSTNPSLVIAFFILSYPLVSIFIRKWKTSVIIWKNCVQLLKPTQFLFLASPPLKNKQHQVPLAKPLSQSPAAIPPAICSSRCSACPHLPSQPHMQPVRGWVRGWQAHNLQPNCAICLPSPRMFLALLLTHIPAAPHPWLVCPHQSCDFQGKDAAWKRWMSCHGDLNIHRKPQTPHTWKYKGVWHKFSLALRFSWFGLQSFPLEVSVWEGSLKPNVAIAECCHDIPPSHVSLLDHKQTTQRNWRLALGLCSECSEGLAVTRPKV